MVDTRGGAFTVGLGLVPGLAVIPRVNTWSHDKVQRTVELAPAGVAVVGVPEATALVRDGAGGAAKGWGTASSTATVRWPTCLRYPATEPLTASRCWLPGSNDFMSTTNQSVSSGAMSPRPPCRRRPGRLGMPSRR